MTVQIFLDERQVQPGGMLKGRVLLSPSPKRKMELSILWQTEGKGSTDIGVIQHRVLESDDSAESAGAEFRFEQRLPLLPVTYTGKLIKVRWLVRVRRFQMFGDDIVVDEEIEVRWPS